MAEAGRQTGKEYIKERERVRWVHLAHMQCQPFPPSVSPGFQLTNSFLSHVIHFILFSHPQPHLPFVFLRQLERHEEVFMAHSGQLPLKCLQKKWQLVFSHGLLDTKSSQTLNNTGKYDRIRH